MEAIKFREFVNGKFHYWGFTEEGIFKGPVTPSLTRGKHSMFTGLIDKNGKEIYEHDAFIEIIGAYPVMFYVIFKDGMFQDDTGDGNSLNDIREMEVIGNIWENPELLKEIESQANNDF